MEPVFSIKFDFESHENITAIKRQYERSPNSAELNLKYAACLAENGRYELASQLFLAAAGLNRNARFESYLKAGVCLVLNELFSDSLNCFKKAMNFEDNHYYLQTFMGISFYRLGLLAKANTHWWAAYQIRKTSFIVSIIENFFVDKYHPERIALYPICVGKGIDVGCGSRKTHPDSIGIDLTQKGSRGKVGNVAGKKSVADITVSGDNLYMFENEELDYVVQRHNLEHYQDYIKALQEWKRVVKRGGLIGMVIPDDDKCDTIRLDPSHKHVFTRESIRRVVELIGGLKIVYMEELLKNWSFICILQRTDGSDGSRIPSFDFVEALNEFDYAQLLKQATAYTEKGQPQLARQCSTYAESIRKGDS